MFLKLYVWKHTISRYKEHPPVSSRYIWIVSIPLISVVSSTLFLLGIPALPASNLSWPQKAKWRNFLRKQKKKGNNKIHDPTVLRVRKLHPPSTSGFTTATLIVFKNHGFLRKFWSNRSRTRNHGRYLWTVSRNKTQWPQLLGQFIRQEAEQKTEERRRERLHHLRFLELLHRWPRYKTCNDSWTWRIKVTGSCNCNCNWKIKESSLHNKKED